MNDVPKPLCGNDVICINDDRSSAKQVFDSAAKVRVPANESNDEEKYVVGMGFLIPHAKAQGAPQSVEIAKVDLQTVAAGYRASKVIGSSVVNDGNETIGKIDDLLVTRTANGKKPQTTMPSLVRDFRRQLVRPRRRTYS